MIKKPSIVEFRTSGVLKDKVVVRADRIMQNAVFNKIGTYSVVVYNLTFDATPLKYIAGIITEDGIYTLKDSARFNPKFPL